MVDIASEFDPTWCGEGHSLEYLVKVIELIKDRIKTLSDIKENAFYFFNHPTEYDEAAIEKTGSGPRQAFMDKHKDRIKNVTTYIGEVTLSK